MMTTRNIKTELLHPSPLPSYYFATDWRFCTRPVRHYLTTYRRKVTMKVAKLFPFTKNTYFKTEIGVWSCI